MSLPCRIRSSLSVGRGFGHYLTASLWKSEYTMSNHHGSTAHIILIASVAALGGLLFGYDTAVISGGIDFIKEHFHLSEAEKGWAASYALVGCIVGAMASGRLAIASVASQCCWCVRPCLPSPVSPRRCPPPSPNSSGLAFWVDSLLAQCRCYRRST